MIVNKFSYKTQPLPHQREALKIGAKDLYYALFMDMGTGKTKVIIDTMSYLFTQDKINLVIVVAPNSVYRSWTDELEKHCSVFYKTYIHKKDKHFKMSDKDLNYYLINVDAFSHDKYARIVEKITHEHGMKTALVLDESTTIKNRTSKRTKNILKISHNVLYKRIMTGSPITKSPMDLFTQCEFLKKGLLGFDNFYTFQLRYAKLFKLNLPGNRYTMIENGFKNLNELEEKIKQFSYRKRKKDCLDLPDKVHQKRYVELSKEQRQYYNQLKEYSRAILEDDMVSYNNKLTEIIKLQQICNGFVKTDSGEIIKLVDPKLKELLHILNEYDGKVIIWSSFVYNIEQIEKELQKEFSPESVVTIYGSVSVEQRKRNVEAFQTNEKVKYFVGNPTTGGYGLNLTKATLVIYYNNSFNLEVRMQSEDRAYRHGQTKEVTILDLIAKDTIDEFVVENLKGKAKLSAQTLGEEALKFL